MPQPAMTGQSAALGRPRQTRRTMIKARGLIWAAATLLAATTIFTPPTTAAPNSRIQALARSSKGIAVPDDAFIGNRAALFLAERHGDDEDEEGEEEDAAEASSGGMAMNEPRPTDEHGEQEHSHEDPHPAMLMPVGHDGHRHSGPVLEHLNETDILLRHGPRGESYYDYDYNLPDSKRNGHGGVIVAHAAALLLALFGLWPLALAFKSAGHHASVAIQLVFLALLGLGTFLGFIYSRATPEHYAGGKHNSLGYVLVLMVSSLALWDVRGALARSRLLRQLLSRLGIKDSSRDSRLARAYEAVGMYEIGEDEDDDLDEKDQHTSTRTGHWSATVSPRQSQEQGRFIDVALDNSVGAGVHQQEAQAAAQRRRGHVAESSYSPMPSRSRPTSPSAAWANAAYPSIPRRESANSNESEATLHDATASNAPIPSLKAGRPRQPRVSPAQRTLSILKTVVERGSILVAFAAVVTGLCTYFRIGYASYGPVVLAHTIKGAVFFWYGILSFMRYLGAFASLGWAWNRAPSASVRWTPSAEMVECSLLLLYGITNTWMERIGAKAGDPYSIKQVQHISIAIMFWFCGALGIMLESQWVRGLLSRDVLQSADQYGAEVQEPSSWKFSFNPFPALVIGVTGLAMAFHHQDYVYEVKIHELWGFLLAGAALFRLLTYFFLFLRPPASILPSRPPTEAVAAISLSAGGFVFMLSMEEISFAAMRSGYDDVMAMLNITVAVIAICFSWVAVVLACRGWALDRVLRAKDTMRLDIPSRTSRTSPRESMAAAASPSTAV